jgi:uncharacterized protein (DUF433 family)
LATTLFETYNQAMLSVVLSDPEIMSGTPCFRGTRVPVKTLSDYLEHGHALDELRALNLRRLILRVISACRTSP